MSIHRFKLHAILLRAVVSGLKLPVCREVKYVAEVCAKFPEGWQGLQLREDRWVSWERQWLDSLMDCPGAKVLNHEEHRVTILNFSGIKVLWKRNLLWGEVKVGPEKQTVSEHVIFSRSNASGPAPGESSPGSSEMEYKLRNSAESKPNEGAVPWWQLH